MMFYIYKLSCRICSHYYIGQTSGTILDRYKQHKQQAHRGSKTTLHTHLRNHGLLNAKIKTIWKIDTDNKELVDDMEMFFIKQLKPKLNICTRRVREIGMKTYLRNYREKMRENQNHRCSLCDINCVARIHLINHFATAKHIKNELKLLSDMDRLGNI